MGGWGYKDNRIRNISGFTLIETLMAIIVLAVVSTGVLMYFMGLSRGGEQGRASEALRLAQERMEDIIAAEKANGFASIPINSPAVNDPVFSTPFDIFTRSVEVYCVNEATPDANNGDTTDACPGSDIVAKRVKVAMSWTGGAVDLTTVFSEH